jgi:transcriptional regulator with XRE-family HTH domain
MMDEKERRAALAAFLRTRRERLQPTDLGLPVRRRRRTPGLRREEVAELANIGVAWYTLLEQGQDVHPSANVLVSLAQALRLNAAEQRQLFLLAQGELPDQHARGKEEQVTPALTRMIDALDPHPALLTGRYWNALAWNRSAAWLFRLQEPCPPYSHNIIWRFFQSEARSLYQEWEKQAQSLVAQFRADYTRYPDDPSFCAIVAALQEHCPQFCQWWEQQNIDDTPNGLRILAHPTLGDLAFEHITLKVPFSSDLRIKVCSMQEDACARLEQALLTLAH